MRWPSVAEAYPNDCLLAQYLQLCSNKSYLQWGSEQYFSVSITLGKQTWELLRQLRSIVCILDEKRVKDQPPGINGLTQEED